MRKCYRTFSQYESDLIKTLYVAAQLSLREIGKVVGAHHWQIGCHLRSFDIPIRMLRGKRLHFLDERAFESIDSSAKAYHLGFLLADGAVDEKRGKLHLTVQTRDVEVIESLKDLLGATQPIRDSMRKYLAKKIAIQSRALVTDLVSHGCVQNKHNKVRFPTTVPEKLYPDFIRGYLDGDGSVFLRHRPGRPSPLPEISVAGTQDMLLAIREIFQQVVGAELPKPTRVSSKCTTWRLKVCSQRATAILAKYLYSSREIAPCLTRKRRAAWEIIDRFGKGVV